MHIAPLRTLLICLSMLMPTSAGLAATYYVSNQGLDKNDGLSSQTSWATLDRVNAGPFQPGDKVLFRRGDVWRGQLVPHCGSEAGHVTYAAYGEGAKPLLLGSVAKSNPADWTSEGNGIWSTGGLPADVGNIIFGNEEACGVKVWREADLKNDGDYWYDQASHVVKLRMSENPAKRYARVECAIRRNIIHPAREGARRRGIRVYGKAALTACVGSAATGLAELAGGRA